MAGANVVWIWGRTPFDPVPLSQLSDEVLQTRLAINGAHRDRLFDEWSALMMELISRIGKPTPPPRGGRPVPRPKAGLTRAAARAA